MRKLIRNNPLEDWEAPVGVVWHLGRLQPYTVWHQGVCMRFFEDEDKARMYYALVKGGTLDSGRQSSPDAAKAGA